MSRKLDALFAEKVLGYTTELGLVVWSTGEDKWRLTARPGKRDIILPYPRPLQRYSRSLDDAWAGLCELPLAISESRALQHDTSDGTRAYACLLDDHEGRASHPAEAIVIACLRAVGVSETEIEAALTD